MKLSPSPSSFSPLTHYHSITDISRHCYNCGRNTLVIEGCWGFNFALCCCSPCSLLCEGCACVVTIPPPPPPILLASMCMCMGLVPFAHAVKSCLGMCPRTFSHHNELDPINIYYSLQFFSSKHQSRWAIPAQFPIHLGLVCLTAPIVQYQFIQIILVPCPFSPFVVLALLAEHHFGIDTALGNCGRACGWVSAQLLPLFNFDCLFALAALYLIHPRASGLYPFNTHWKQKTISCFHNRAVFIVSCTIGWFQLDGDVFLALRLTTWSIIAALKMQAKKCIE
jgi:hypothetical protein